MDRVIVAEEEDRPWSKWYPEYELILPLQINMAEWRIYAFVYVGWYWAFSIPTANSWDETFPHTYKLTTIPFQNRRETTSTIFPSHIKFCRRLNMSPPYTNPHLRWLLSLRLVNNRTLILMLRGIRHSQSQKLVQEVKLFLTFRSWPPTPFTTYVGQSQ